MKEMAKNWKCAVVCLGLGQLLSLLITSTQFTSSQLQNKGMYAPYTLSSLNYLLLTLFYGGIMIYRRQSPKLTLNCYTLLGCIDALAYNFVVLSYERTSLTSVSLLECWIIPCVLLLTWFFLNTKYRFQNLVGALICVAGLATFVFFKVHSADRSSGISLKDLSFIILGATLYGVSNVCQESFVKKTDRVEVMALFGIHGVFFSALKIAIFERNELKSIYYSSLGAILPTIGYSLAMFLFYSGVPLLLKISGSTMLNLSLLTSDMWAVLIRVFAYHEKADWTYFLAFAAVTIGLIVYSGGDKMGPNNARISNLDVESSRIDDEGGITIRN